MFGIALYLMVLAVVYLDARDLERVDTVLYRRVMVFGPWGWVAFSVLWVGAVVYWVQRKRLLTVLATADPFLVEPLSPRFAVAREAASVLILWFVVSQPAVYLVGMVLGLTDRPEHVQFVAGELVITVVMVAVMVKVIGAGGRGGFWEVTGWRGGTFSFGSSVALPVIVGLGLAHLVIWTGSLAHDPVTPLDETLDAAGLPTAIVFTLLAVGLAPFFEELVFRGYLFGVIETLKGAAPAVVIVSLLFALLHVEQYWGDWLLVGWILLGSFAFSAFRLRSGSTLPPTLSHYAYNAGVFIAPLVLLWVQSPSYARYLAGGEELTPERRQELLLAALDEDPDNAGAMNDLAWLYATEDRELERAFELIEKALELEPDEAAFIDTRAEVLFGLGRVDEAIAVAEWLVAEYPDDDYFAEQLEKFRREARE